MHAQMWCIYWEGTRGCGNQERQGRLPMYTTVQESKHWCPTDYLWQVRKTNAVEKSALCVQVTSMEDSMHIHKNGQLNYKHL